MIDANLVESIRAKKQKQVYLLRALELWAAAEAQGIDSSEGGSFGLDTRLFTKKQKREWQRYNGRFVKRDRTGAVQLKLYNYFRYPDGQVVVLDPFLEAVCCESFA